MNRNPKILVLGHARHGKDTASEVLRDDYDMSFTSSSLFCAERIVMPVMNANFPGMYGTAQECFDDRVNHREAWYNIIRDFNRYDAAALGCAIFDEHDVYCGLRSKAEFHALKNAGVFDMSMWIDASDRLPPEGALSCTVEPWMADYVVDNNGPDVEALRRNVRSLMTNWLEVHWLCREAFA